ncbi:MAG: dihydroorotase [Bacillota bacterium]|nr:dihydroorotase [Bacillota bacterium]
MNLMILNAKIVHPRPLGAACTEPGTGTIYIVDGVFAERDQATAAGLIDADGAPREGTDVVDATGLYALPGLIDAHAHLRDPGQEYKESIATGTRAAARGGFTSVLCMPNTIPVIDNAAVVRYVIDKARREGAVNVFPIGAVTKGQQGVEIAEIGLMQEAGAVAVSDDGAPVSTAAMLQRALLYAADFGIPVIDHCEDLSLAAGGLMNEGLNSTVMGVQGIPAVAEDIIVARDIELAGYLGLSIHLAHISTAGAVALIRRAKARGIRVTCETCPHYFTLTDDHCLGFNTLARVNPPLRRPEDVAAVIEGLADGTIDMIATDHAPHHDDEKDIEFAHARNGMTGLETAWQLAWTRLVLPGHLEIGDLARLMSRAPSERFGLGRGGFEAGKPADLILVDPEREVTVDRFRMLSRAHNSPYHGMTLQSDVVRTYVGGREVYRG